MLDAVPRVQSSSYPKIQWYLPRRAVLPLERKKNIWENKLHMMDVSHGAYSTPGTISTWDSSTYIQELG